MRPKTLGDFLGQEKIFGEGSFLRRTIDEDQVPSLIFWGPPGSGKTTLALLIAQSTQAEFFQLSAVGSGVKDLRKIIEVAEKNKEGGKKTLLFIDEIHRWNKSQQDSLLPYVERGVLTLIGATTENPSFEVNGALLSRSRVVVLEKHSVTSLVHLLRQALMKSQEYFGRTVDANNETLGFIAEVSGGDARQALGILEACVVMLGKKKILDSTLVESVVKRSHVLYDKGGEEHYNIISALHKSLRGGDANAALYWLARMLEAGEDPLYVARRLVRFASEDIGLANSFALPQATAAYQACQYLGMPECEVHLAQLVVYLASSKKSNALYVAYNKAKEDVHRFPNEPVPLYLRNAPTKLLKDIGYGKGYKYTPAHNTLHNEAGRPNNGGRGGYTRDEDLGVQQEYLPEKLKGKKYIDIKEK